MSSRLRRSLSFLSCYEPPFAAVVLFLLAERLDLDNDLLEVAPPSVPEYRLRALLGLSRVAWSSGWRFYLWVISTMP